MLARKPSLSAYLSRQEWQLVFALSFVHQALGDAGPFDSFGDELRYAVAWLAENGFEFEGLKVLADGRIVPKQEAPICPENLASCALILYSSAPDYRTHLEAAAFVLAERTPHLRHEIDRIHEALSEVEAALEAA